jgi:hypothetical protein
VINFNTAVLCTRVKLDLPPKMKNPQAIIVLLSLLQWPRSAKKDASNTKITADPVKIVHDLKAKGKRYPRDKTNKYLTYVWAVNQF